MRRLPVKRSISLNLVKPDELIEILNGPALAPDVYNTDTVTRSRRRISIGEVMREIQKGTRGWLSEEFAHSWGLVRGARLRQLVDEWMGTGLSGDGDWSARRDLLRTSEAIAAVQKCAETNPCTLSFDKTTGALAVNLDQARLWQGYALPWQSEIDEANRLFTSMMASEDWKHWICKCSYGPCSKYFLLKRSARKARKNGTFCCREHQAKATASKLTREMRKWVESELVLRAARRLLSFGIANADWQLDKRMKQRVAKGVHQYLSNTKDPRLRRYHQVVKLAVGWVTRHQQKIEQSRRELESGELVNR